MQRNCCKRKCVVQKINGNAGVFHTMFKWTQKSQRDSNVYCLNVMQIVKEWLWFYMAVGLNMMIFTPRTRPIVFSVWKLIFHCTFDMEWQWKMTTLFNYCSFGLFTRAMVMSIVNINGVWCERVRVCVR